MKKDYEDKPSQATQIVDSVMHCPVFYDQEGRTFISLNKNGHIENKQINDRSFENELANQFYESTRTVANKSAIKDAIATLEGRARAIGSMRTSFLRVGHFGDEYFLDLGCPNWNYIHLKASAWSIAQDAPVAFFRKPSTQELPEPIAGGNIDQLWQFLNIPNESRLLVITAILDYWRSDTPHPVLVFDGEQGSAKSTTQQFLKRLIDPSGMNLRSAPKGSKDLFIAAANEHVISYNNLSALSGSLQDGMCCLATGGAHAARTLYSDTDETVVNIKRPVMLNGIGQLVTQQDLLERTLYVLLPRLSADTRQTESDIEQAFNKQQATILGALLDLFCKALSYLPQVSAQGLHRLADYHRLGRATAMALGYEASSFDIALKRNQKRVVSKGLEDSPIYSALCAYLKHRQRSFHGAYGLLLEELSRFKPMDSHNWPNNAKALANTVKREAGAYRQMGINIHFDEVRRAEGYFIKIWEKEVSAACA